MEISKNKYVCQKFQPDNSKFAKAHTSFEKFKIKYSLK